MVWGVLPAREPPLVAPQATHGCIVANPGSSGPVRRGRALEASKGPRFGGRVSGIDWSVAANLLSSPGNCADTCFHPERPCELYENRAVNQSDTPTCQCPPGTGYAAPAQANPFFNAGDSSRRPEGFELRCAVPQPELGPLGQSGVSGGVFYTHTRTHGRCPQTEGKQPWLGPRVVRRGTPPPGGTHTAQQSSRRVPESSATHTPTHTHRRRAQIEEAT